jgi:hypothetical protein
VSERKMPSDEVATHCGPPVMKFVWRMVPPVEEARVVRSDDEVAKIRSPARYEERPVPPFAAERAVAKVRAPVEEKVDVAVPPKYAVLKTESSDVEALRNDWSAVKEFAAPGET